ncbi:MAG: peptidylprolyl isomerase [Kiloniellaceae bacterium]
MTKKPFAAALLVAGLAFAAGSAAPSAWAQDTAAPDAAAPDAGEKSDVVAVVNGKEINESDLVAFIQQLPPQLQSQVQMLMPQILDQLVNNALSSDAGRSAGLATDEEVQSRVSKIEDLIIGQTYLQRAIDKRVTDEKLEAAYQAFIAENPPQRELKARHILVETEDEAKGLIAELDGGADFAELAKAHSTGPSGASGGELPPFKEGEMVPAFSDAAFAMEVGSYSKEPVKTQFGYHVIKLEGSSMAEPPAKEAVEGQLRDKLSQEAVEEIYAELRDGAEIDILLGKPAPGEAPAATPESGEAAPDAPAPGSN